MPDGTVWVSDPDSGDIEHLDADGARARHASPTRRRRRGWSPSAAGIVLAEQRTNRLVRLHAARPPRGRTVADAAAAWRGRRASTASVSTPASGLLLIPDSPHGTLLSADRRRHRGANHGHRAGARRRRHRRSRTAPSGWRSRERAGCCACPPPAARRQRWAAADLTQLDDIIAVGSLLYATSLTTNEVVAIDPATGADRVLVTGGHSLQGLALLADGRLARRRLDEPGHRHLRRRAERPSRGGAGRRRCGSLSTCPAPRLLRLALRGRRRRGRRRLRIDRAVAVADDALASRPSASATASARHRRAATADACAVPAQSPPPSGFAANFVTALAFAPDGRLFYTERAGTREGVAERRRQDVRHGADGDHRGGRRLQRTRPARPGDQPDVQRRPLRLRLLLRRQPHPAARHPLEGLRRRRDQRRPCW